MMENSWLDRHCPLKDHLKIHKVKDNVYEGTDLYRPSRGRAGYGGQLMAQCLMAAANTVAEKRMRAKSLHIYFIKGASTSLPVDYHVDRIDENTVSALRGVRGVQKGKVILQANVLFASPSSRSSVVSTSIDCHVPEVSPYDTLESYTQLMHEYMTKSDWPPDKLDKGHKSLEQMSSVPHRIRPVDPKTFLHYNGFPDKAENLSRQPEQFLWLKVANVADVNPAHTPAVVAAYVSDWQSMLPSRFPHPFLSKVPSVSLDHSIWFHGDFQPSDWLLQETHCPILCNGRFLIHGRLWTEGGALVASFAQEGLLLEKSNKL